MRSEMKMTSGILRRLTALLAVLALMISLQPGILADDDAAKDQPCTDPAGHSYEAAVTDPTILAKGYTTYTCSICGNSYIDEDSYTDPLTPEDGWNGLDGKWYYGADGELQTGWIRDSGSWYYLNELGCLETGWFQDGSRWYFANKDGVMQTGWVKSGSKWYFLNPVGVMQTGWITDQGQRYYLNPDGDMKTGWLQDGTSWYYLKNDGTPKTGWLKYRNKWYYFASDGVMATGWAVVDGKTYYLSTDGAMKTGWFQDGGKWYCAKTDGTLKTGWVKYSGSWYYLDISTGTITTGWLTLGSAKYYLDSSGAMVTGTRTIDGTSYSFDSSGKLITQTTSSSKIDPNKPMVALTYDDGPYTPVTSRILDALEKVGGHCTFFNVGNRCSTYSAVIKRAVSMGCTVDNHSWDHTSLTSLSASGITTSTSKCTNAIYNATGVYPKLVRPVGGAINSTVRSTVNYPLILWSIDTLDWSSRNATSVYNKVIGHVQDGDIILMHDLYTSTAAASEKIIPELVREGYQLVTVEELAYYKGYTLKNGTAYYSFR